jgi:lipoate-protein ligase A
MHSTAPASPSRTTRLLPTLELSGRWQMAIDRWLLAQGQPALRLYRWAQPCLSLGRHQRQLPPPWLELAASGGLELVRRPSGGGAVLHGGDLSYCLIWPGAPADRRAAYRQACGWLLRAFADLGLPLVFGDQPAGLPARSCFASSSAADLVHAQATTQVTAHGGGSATTPAAVGTKRIGSAQFWQGGRLLQHGSIQLEPDGGRWQALFGVPAPALPPLPCRGESLEERLLEAAARTWPELGLAPLALQPLSSAELGAVGEGLVEGQV